MKIESVELLQRIGQHERYLIGQLKRTENKRFYYQLQTIRKIKKYVSEIETEGADNGGT